MHCTQQEDSSLNVPVYNMHISAPSAYTESVFLLVFFVCWLFFFCGGLHYGLDHGCMETHLNLDVYPGPDLDTY